VQLRPHVSRLPIFSAGDIVSPKRVAAAASGDVPEFCAEYAHLTLDKTMNNQSTTNPSFVNCWYVTVAICVLAGFFLCLWSSFHHHVTLATWRFLPALLLHFSPLRIGVPGVVILFIFLIVLCFALLAAILHNFVRTGINRAIVGVIVVTILCALDTFATQQSQRRQREARNRSIEQYAQIATDKLAANPNDSYALHWFGVHHFSRTGNNQEAVRCFEKLISSGSNDANADSYKQRGLLYLALLYQKQGMSKKAVESFDKFMKTNPDMTNDLVLRNYCAIYLDRVKKKER